MKFDKHIDSILVKNYQSGNKEALASLVKRWHLRFCKQAFWIVKDADLSKDIAQETWQTIIVKIDNLQDANSFGNWGLRIIYSKSLDVLRKKSKEQLNKSEYIKSQITTETEYNEDIIIKIRLLQAIKMLPEQQQVVLKLFYLEDYSLKEISKTIKITEGTAKSRLFYAREKLRKVLNNNQK